MATPLRLRFALPLLLALGSALAGDPPRTIDEALAVQEALRQGRDLLVQGDTTKAVDLLEKQLSRVHGDPNYLALLKDAYRAHIKNLQLANRFETCETYRKRLAVIDRELPKNAAPAALAVPAAMPKPEVVRGARPEEDPFTQTPLAERSESTPDFVQQAAAAFTAKQYTQAAELYQKAEQGGAVLSPDHKKQWAYARFSAVVEKVNDANPHSAANLEKEVRGGLQLCAGDAKLTQVGQDLLKEIAARSGAPGSPANPPAGEGWTKVEATNFRIFHKGQAELAAEVQKVAEHYRTAAFAKWSTPYASRWQPVCDVYLYPRADDYVTATKQPGNSPGHSTIKAQGGRVVARRMDLRTDDPNFLGSTLPHEITHVVLADLFSDGSLPRWADEGMAVLAEPRGQVERYQKTLVNCRKRGQLLPLAQILAGSEYPDAASITVFYVESVSVVDFMVNLKGPTEFVAFLQAAKGDFNSALMKHYRIRNVAELQDHWLRATFTEIDRVAGK